MVRKIAGPRDFMGEQWGDRGGGCLPVSLVHDWKKGRPKGPAKPGRRGQGKQTQVKGNKALQHLIVDRTEHTEKRR